MTRGDLSKLADAPCSADVINRIFFGWPVVSATCHIAMKTRYSLAAPAKDRQGTSCRVMHTGKNKLRSCNADEECSLSIQRSPDMTSPRTGKICWLSCAFTVPFAWSYLWRKELSLGMLSILIGSVVTEKDVQTWVPSFLNLREAPKDLK